MRDGLSNGISQAALAPKWTKPRMEGENWVWRSADAAAHLHPDSLSPSWKHIWLRGQHLPQLEQLRSLNQSGTAIKLAPGSGGAEMCLLAGEGRGGEEKAELL